MDISITNANKLDPKLKETYDRIMGNGGQSINIQVTQVPHPLTHNTQQNPISNQQQDNSTSMPPMPTLKIPTQTQNIQQQELNNPLPPTAPVAPISPFQETPPPPKFETQIIQDQPPFSGQTPIQEQDILSSPLLQSTTYMNPQLNQNTAVNQSHQTKKLKKGHGLISFILGVGMVIFLVIYAGVWAKVFGLF